MLTENQLLQMKKRVDDSKQLVSELQGQQKAQLKQLKDDWNCDSIEAAETQIKKFGKEIEVLNQEIEENINELEEIYNG